MLPWQSFIISFTSLVWFDIIITVIFYQKKATKVFRLGYFVFAKI